MVFMTLALMHARHHQRNNILKKTSRSIRHDVSQYIATPTTTTSAEHGGCPWKYSSLYQSIYVYPLPGQQDWTANYKIILSSTSKEHRHDDAYFSWMQEADDGSADDSGDSTILARTIHRVMTHPDSCLRTRSPQKAKLFVIPPTMLRENDPDVRMALENAFRYGKYGMWEATFGWTAYYLKRNNGADHILVDPNKSRKMTDAITFAASDRGRLPPITVGLDPLVQHPPRCHHQQQHIQMPAVVTAKDSQLEATIAHDLQQKLNLTGLQASTAALWSEKRIAEKGNEHLGGNGVEGETVPRIYSLYYHPSGDSNSTVARTLQREYQCSASGRLAAKHEVQGVPASPHQASFCPMTDACTSRDLVEAIHAGCIPVLIGNDNNDVDESWPLLTIITDTDHQQHYRDFVLQLSSHQFQKSHFDASCRRVATDPNAIPPPTLQSLLEQLPSSEVRTKRQAVRRASERLSYFKTRVDQPLTYDYSTVLPDGGAVHTFIAALEACWRFGEKHGWKRKIYCIGKKKKESSVA